MCGKSELPAGWVSVAIPEFCEINPSKPPRDSIPTDTPVTFVPMPAVDAELGTITNPEIRKFADARNGFTFFQEGDIIIAKITPCMENGKAAIARNLINGLGFGSTEFFTLRPNGSAIPEYLYHYVRQESFRKEAEENMTGSVGQKRVPKHFIEGTIIPLPPLAEQRRIVAAVEALLAGVNATRKRLDHMPWLLKKFRQAVLASACQGSLTADWKEEHIGLSDWKRIAIEDIAEKVIDYRGRTPPIVKEPEIPHITTTNIRDGKINWATVKFVTEDTYRTYMTRGIPEIGDVFFTMEGPLGEVAVLHEHRKFSVAQRILIIRGKKDIIYGDYFAFALMSPYFQSAINLKSTGSGVKGVAYKRMKHVELPVPPLAEQQEIIRRVEALFTLTHHIEQRVAVSKDRADRLIQSILEKAFCGQLVPTEAELSRKEEREYEPASILLERIRKGGRLRREMEER